MKKHSEPKRKVGKSMDKDIEMIERCLEKEDNEFESDDNYEESSMRNNEDSDDRKQKVQASKEIKTGITKSVSWSESEENTPRPSRSNIAPKQPQNLGARPKTGRHLKPLTRQKQSLEDTNSTMDDIHETGEDTSMFKHESETVTKTTSVIKRSSTLMEKIRQRSSQSRTRSDASEDDDSSDSDKDDKERKNNELSSDEEDHTYQEEVKPKEESDNDDEEEIKETVGPLKKLSSNRKKSSSSSIGGDKKASKRPTLQKQGSRYDIRLREEDHSAQIAFEKRQESRRDKSKKHWSDLRDSVHSGSFHSLSGPSKEECYDFFTKVWENTSPLNIPISQQKRRGRDEDRRKKKQRRGDSRDDQSGESDEDMDGNESESEDR